jgi:hypothetical protein
MRWKLSPQIFSHCWELPEHLTGEGGRTGDGIPADARAKPGSGGQYIAFVPSLDLVVTRQTGGSGEWPFEEYLRRACRAVLGEAMGLNKPRTRWSCSTAAQPPTRACVSDGPRATRTQFFAEPRFPIAC